MLTVAATAVAATAVAATVFAPASRIPGVFTFYPWPKLRLVSDPFDPDQAAEAINRIKSLVARAKQPPPAPAAATPGQPPRDH